MVREDIKMERLSSAQLGKAGFLEGIEETYPDYGALMQAVSATGAGGETTTTTPWGVSGSRAGDITSLPGRAGSAATPSAYGVGTGAGEVGARGAGATTQKDVPRKPGIALEDRPSNWDEMSNQEQIAWFGSQGIFGTDIRATTSTAPGSFYQGAYDILAGKTPQDLTGGGGTGVEGTTSMTVYNTYTGRGPASKVIQVPLSALGSGPGGFKDEKTYKAYMPSGFRTRPR